MTTTLFFVYKKKKKKKKKGGGGGGVLISKTEVSIFTEHSLICTKKSREFENTIFISIYLYVKKFRESEHAW